MWQAWVAGMEVSLMKRYGKSSRSGLLKERLEVNDDERRLAQEFDYEYFDGPRRLGLGGFKYIPGYWSPVVEDFIEYYKLDNYSSILDVGCGKGFTMFEFAIQLPGARISGLERSKYCINNSLPIIRPHIKFGCCSDLPYDSNSFDFAFAIATIHNLDINGVKRSLRELMRVSKRSFVKVNGYRTEEECRELNEWNLVAKTILSAEQWDKLFKEVGYDREWEFFTPLG
jgi:SAM-dependent methyltransferase